MKNMLDWQNLNYFICLAKFQRLSTAASYLKSTPSTVSRRVKALEKEMDLELFKTTPQGHVLTPHGKELLHQCGDLDDWIDRISRSMVGVGDELKGEVVLTTVSTFASTLIPALLIDLKVKYPQLNVKVISSKEFFNLSKREADIALRPTLTPPPYLIGKNLGRTQFSLYASNKYLKSHPVEFLPAEIAKHCFIDLEESLGHLLSKKWLDQFTLGHTNKVIADSVFTSIFFCSEGLGIAALPTYLESYFPKLKPIYQPSENLGSDLWVLTHKDYHQTPKIKVVADELYSFAKKRLSPYLSQD